MCKNRDGSATAQFTSNKITGGGPEVEGESKKAFNQATSPRDGSRSRARGGRSLVSFFLAASSFARSLPHSPPPARSQLARTFRHARSLATRSSLYPRSLARSPHGARLLAARSLPLCRSLVPLCRERLPILLTPCLCRQFFFLALLSWPSFCGGSVAAFVSLACRMPPAGSITRSSLVALPLARALCLARSLTARSPLARE